MVLEGLGKSLRNVLGRIGSASSVDEELIKDICKDLQRALLEADVNVRLVLDVTNRVKERALNEAPEAGRSMKDHVVRIIREELVRMVNSDVPGIAVKPQTIMMVGLYGQGKTTTTGKLALYFSKKNLTVGLIGADVYRPAALDQLKQLGEKVGVEVYGEPGQTDAALIVKHGLEHFKDKKMVIIDTSGRHALEDDLIDEIKRIAEVAKPDERILVLDAQVGQQAGPQAEAFHNAVGVTGVILTKMDGTAKGGGALSAISKTNARIVFMGTGEHIRDLEAFDPQRFIGRLLGMGDLGTLVQMASEEMDDPEKAQELLAEAGYPDGFSFTITVPSNYQPHVDTATVLVEQLAAVGVNAEIQLVDWNTWVNDVYGGRNFQSTVVGFDSSTLNASGMLARWVSDNDKNMINYNNADYDAAYAAAQSTVDDEEQTAYYKECLQILSDTAANVYLQDLADFVAMHPDLKGYEFYPLYVIDMSKLYFDTAA